MEQLNILVVDDDPDLAESIAEALTLAGHKVCTAGNGAEAVERFAQTKYDLTLLDCRMPVMNGIDCFFAIRASHPDAKIVLMTGFADMGVERAMAAGAHALLQKPFRMGEILKLAGHSARRHQDRPVAAADSLSAEGGHGD
ncbi:MAG TPA: response regulator [Dongiaceae bacterium]|jgi:CheY-like chemotaxis protein